MEDKIQFGYWPIRGRAQPSRLVMAYCGIDFQQVDYTDPNVWFGKDKQNLGIPLPNLPYLIDGDVKISQSLVIPKYIVRKAGKLDLLGKNPKDIALVDSILHAWESLSSQFTSLALSKKWQDQRAPMFFKIKQRLQRFQKLFAQKNFCIGYLTIADFVISEGSYHLQRHFYEEYSKLNSFQKIRESVQNLPEVKAYYQKETAIKTPMMSPYYATIPMGIQDIGPKKENMAPSSPLKTSKISPKKKEIKQGSLKILAISGSLRKASTNTGLIRACIEINHPQLEIEIGDISQFPMFNQDLQKNPLPSCIKKIKEQIKQADGVLFAVPQNNFNVSAPLKNAYDWISRGQTPIKQKPAAMMSSAAMTGGTKGQAGFRTTIQYCKVKMMQKPEILVKRFSGKYFDDDGNLINQQIKGQLKEFLNTFVEWIKANKKSQ